MNTQFNNLFTVPRTLPSSRDEILDLTKDLEAIVIPEVNSDGTVIEASNILKDLKNLKKDVAAKKKIEIEPLELIRKSTEIAFDNAKASKKFVGDPYDSVRKTIDSLDKGFRGAITGFTETVRAKQEEEARVMAESLNKVEDKLTQAKNLMERASDASNFGEFETATELKESADVAMQEFHDMELNKTEDVGASHVIPIGISHYIDFRVTDESLLPLSFYDLVPDEEHIKSVLNTVLPGVLITGVDIDSKVIETKYKIKAIDRKKVIAYLKDDETNVIPGIIKIIKDRTTVRS